MTVVTQRATSQPGNRAFVEIDRVSRRFGEVMALAGVSLRLRRGEIVALLGPSGCGKSTLLRVVAGLEQPGAGDIRIEGESVVALPAYRRPVNMMFQSYALFPHMTVEQNVAFGLRQARQSADAIEARVTEMLRLVRMESFRERRPDQLSGGQQQRVALARSLAREPRLLLLDEPMGALDRKLRAEMQFELGEILRRVRVTCLIVTHDPEEAMVMSDRIALMRDGDIVQEGPPREVYQYPNSRFSAEFLGPANMLAGTVAGVGDGIAHVDLPLLARVVEVGLRDVTVAEGEAAALVLRPEEMSLRHERPGEPAGTLAVTVDDVAYLGTHMTYRVHLAGGEHFIVRQPPEREHESFLSGDRAILEWDGADAVLVPA